MSQVQRIIKYCAIGFAVFLAVNIVSGIFFGLMSVGSLFNKKTLNDNQGILKVLKVERSHYNELEIDVLSSSVFIKEGENFKVETNNKYIKVVEDGDTLEIEEKKHFVNNSDNKVVVYVPADYTFSEVSFDGGAGTIEIEKLTTRDISLDLGAGKVEVDNLIVTGEADIGGGAGDIVINDGIINNLDLDMGVGKFTMKAKLTGNSDIDAGVGDVEVLLMGSELDYSVRINKGVGKTSVNGKSVSNNTTYGSGVNNLFIAGGVGKIVLNFSE